jgi:PAS domain S-box-containing protein
MSPEVANASPTLLATIVEFRRRDRNESIRVRKGGQQLKVAATFSPVRDGAGTIVKILSIAHDVTEAQRGDPRSTCLAYEGTIRRAR